MILLDGSESAPVRLCRRKALECQSTALTTTDPNIRRKYLHLAKLWRQMAGEAERRTNGSPFPKGEGVVLFLNQFQKSR
jgi:hypothetical protein